MKLCARVVGWSFTFRERFRILLSMFMSVQRSLGVYLLVWFRIDGHLLRRIYHSVVCPAWSVHVNRIFDVDPLS